MGNLKFCVSTLVMYNNLSSIVVSLGPLSFSYLWDIHMAVGFGWPARVNPRVHSRLSLLEQMTARPEIYTLYYSINMIIISLIKAFESNPYIKVTWCLSVCLSVFSFTLEVINLS